MKTLFEIKEPLPFDEKIFDKLSAGAKAALDGANKGEFTQAVALLNEGGKVYCRLIQNALDAEHIDEKELIAKLDGAKISRILCMWQDGAIDIPSHDLRKLLLLSNSDNADAGIFVRTAQGYSVIKLENTMK